MLPDRVSNPGPPGILCYTLCLLLSTLRYVQETFDLLSEHAFGVYILNCCLKVRKAADRNKPLHP